MMQHIAMVNGSPIDQFEFDQMVQSYSLETYKKKADQLNDEEQKEARNFALVKVLARELIFQSALSYGVVATEKSVDEVMDDTVKDFKGVEEFEQALMRGGIDVAYYRRMIRKDLTVNLMSEKKLAEVPEPDSEAIEGVYNSYPDKMCELPSVRANHILVMISEGDVEAAEREINRIHAMVDEKPFEELAQQFSQCPSATNGGDLGYFQERDMVPEFSKLAFSLEPGVVGGPVQTQFGFHLIRVKERNEGRTLSLEESTPKIVQFLKQEEGSKLLEDWVNDLKQEAAVELKIEV